MDNSFCLSDSIGGGGIVVDCIVEDDRWAALLTPRVKDRMLSIISAALVHHDYADVEVAILFSDDGKLQVLNKTHRGKDEATDILSFPSDDGDFLGDLALSYDSLSGQAAQMVISLEEHLLHLLVHGVLHLLGFDHESDSDAAVMEGLEINFLSVYGIANPYAPPPKIREHKA